MSAQTIKQASAAQAGSQPPTAESLGWQLRAALPPLKLRSVSMYDPQGDVLWLSEGALGPDEQAFVAEALRVLTEEPSTAHHERDFGDGRGALFLAVRSPQAELVGLVMLLVAGKALASGSLAARVLSAPVRALLQRLAIVLRPQARPACTEPAPANTSGVSSAATGLRNLEVLEWTVSEPSASPAEQDAGGSTPHDTAQVTDEAAAPGLADEILSFELSQSESLPQRTGEVPTARAAGELHVQELTKLRPGGRLRRFHVLPRPPLTLEQGLLAPVRELGAWLGAHPEILDGANLHFSLAVSVGALADDGLPQALAECVGSSGIAPACLGFELAESACIRDRDRAERLVRAIERLGCFLVLDDFTLDTSALELLRSPALRLLKVDGVLTRATLRDKLAQARVVAISQAARVLGVHCAAKHIDTAATHRWLAAAGFDFAEGLLFGAPRMLDSLARELADGR
ncbi:MAG: EAL domain-containing protein [Steroidobacteraceae bacterium]